MDLKECVTCSYKTTIERLEEDSKRNSETHDRFYKDFEELRTKDAVRDERDKNIFQLLQNIQTDIAIMKEKPAKRWDLLAITGITATVTFFVNYFLNTIK